MTSQPALLLIGPPEHGVTEYAGQLATAVDEITGVATDVVVDPVRGPQTVPGTGPVHLQVTDKLFGRDPADAAAWIETLAATRPVTLTLHDLPQPSDGRVSMQRRAAAYRRMVDAAAGIVCNSHHEAALLDEYTPGTRSTPAIIPLPLTPIPGIGRPRRDPVPVVALLGYVYPGKGHAEVLEAAGAIRGVADLGVLAIGAPSSGHEADVAALTARAAELSVSFTVTGYLPTPAMVELCRVAAVPIAAHQHLSASASLNTWIAAGRRPLVPDGRYIREMAALRPGTVTVYDPAMLPAALVDCVEHPGSTWLSSDAHLGPDATEVALRYLRWWTEVFR